MCIGCWEQRHVPIFIRGPLAIPYRLAGIRPSGMNPNLCTRCETTFTRIMRSAQLQMPLTILFADVRGYTGLSAAAGAPEVSAMLGRFYHTCAEIIWERDGIINKLIGDAVLAVFNFPLSRPDHVERAVEAGLELQRRCSVEGPDSPIALGDGHAIGVGVGIHTGATLIGEVGQMLRDFTVIGPVVNLTARLQGAARPGEVLVTPEVFEQASSLLPGAVRSTYELKGLDGPVEAYAYKA
jgi:class 3 adenylate cyclase